MTQTAEIEALVESQGELSEGKLSLPPGYALEYGADALLLRREEGSVVAVFSVRGVTSSDVARTAWHDHSEKSRSTA